MINLALNAIEQRALINSIIISSGVSFFAVIISLFLAISLYFFKAPGKKVFPLLFLIPLLIPPYLHAFSWMHLLIMLGIRIEILSSIPGVIFLLTLSYFPISFFIIHQAVHNIPQEAIDSAIQNSGPSKVLRRIIIPSIIPSLVTAAVVTFILTFITFDVPAFLGKNTFITQIFKSFTLTQEIPRALYLSFIPVLLIGTIWLVLILFVVRNKPFFSTQLQKTKNFYPIKISRPLIYIIFSFFIVIVALSSVLPVVVLQIKNFFLNYSPPVNAVSSTPVIINTLWISLISSVVIVVFSFSVFLFLYKNFIGRLFMLSLLAVPPIAFGILFIYIFNQPAFNFIYGTPIILIIAYTIRFAPLVCELFYIHSKQINPQYFEALYLLPLPKTKKFLTVVVPLYKRPLFYAWMFSFWLVATELPITLLVQPPGFQTIISRLFIVLHYGAEETMGVLTWILLAVSLFPIVAVYWFTRVDRIK